MKGVKLPVNKMGKRWLTIRGILIPIVALMIFGLMTGCLIKSQRDFTVKEFLTAEEMGEISYGTINLDGKVAVSDGWVYWERNWKMKADGTEKVRLEDMNAYSLQISGDWIYYMDFEDYSLNRIKKDGSEKMKMDAGPIVSFVISNDSIFFNKGISIKEREALLRKDSDDKIESKLALYRIKTDGTGETKLAENGLKPFATHEWIYFNDIQGDLFRIQTDGTETFKIAENAGIDYASGEWLYDCTLTPEKGNLNQVTLVRMKPDGTARSEMIRLNGVMDFCFDNGMFYYTSGKGLSRIELAGLGEEKLNNIQIDDLIGVYGNWMYISVEADWGNWYRYQVKLNGTVGLELKGISE